MKTKHKGQFFAAFGIGVFTVALFLCVVSLCNWLFTPSALRNPVFSWQYNMSIYDHLPLSYDWVKDIAYEKHVDDEGANVYIYNICGDSVPEVIFNYQRDGIIFNNSSTLEVYSNSKKVLKRDDGDSIILFNSISLIRWANGETINSVGYPWLNQSYIFSNGVYKATKEFLPFLLIWRYAICFAWSHVSIYFELSMVFLLIQLISFAVYAKFIKGYRKYTIVISLSFFRIILLISIGNIYSIIGLIVPLLLLVGPLIGCIAFATLASLPFEEWFASKHE